MKVFRNKKKGEKTWWIEQAEKYLNEKQQIKNIIEILKTWIDKPIRKLQAIKKLKKPLRTRLTQLVGQGLTDWENIRQQIKEYNSTTSRGLLEEITNLVENNSNICKTTEENKDILDLEKLNSPNFNSNKLFRGDYVITAKKCENNIDARGDRDFPKYCVEDKNNNSIDFKYSWYTMDSIRRQLSNNDEELAANISDFAIDPSENCNTEEEEDEAEEMNCDNLIIDAYEAAQSTSKKDSDLIEGEEEETVFELGDYTYEEKNLLKVYFPRNNNQGILGR